MYEFEESFFEGFLFFFFSFSIISRVFFSNIDHDVLFFFFLLSRKNGRMQDDFGTKWQKFLTITEQVSVLNFNVNVQR